MSYNPTAFRFDPETKAMLKRLTAYRKGPNGSQTALVMELIRQEFFAAQKEIERHEKSRKE